MGSKKRVVLDLNAKVKVIEASEKDKLTVKQIAGKFKIGKTQVYDILKSKSDIKRELLTGNGSMKRKLKETGNEDLNETVWDWFVSARAKSLAYLGECCNRKQKKWLIN
jgi:replication initiation and membrane attachment protein DnaB